MPVCPVPVCIAGMHRSGTSMITNLLHLSGLYLGPEQELLPPSPSNVHGHWENVRFLQINDQILCNMGAGWDHPPALAETWQPERFPRILVERALALLHDFRDQEPWGWKDPRNSLTLPFWINLVPNAKVVICVRNPLEVALSLERRNGFTYAHGLDLWTAYNLSLLVNTTPQQRLFTDYDCYFSDPQRELRRILDFLGISVRRAILDQACNSIKTTLRHEQVTTHQFISVGFASDVLDLYRRITEDGQARHGQTLRARGPGNADRPQIDSCPDEALPAPGIETLQRVALRFAVDQKRVDQAFSDPQSRDGRELEKRDLTDQATLLKNIEVAIRDQHVELNKRIDGLQKSLHEHEWDMEYRDLVHRIREIVRETLPRNAKVVVVSHGDPDLLMLDGRVAWHFPPAEDGKCAGGYPGDGAEAISQLETLRERGADCFLLPSTGLWWLEDYPEFGRYLEDYPCIVRDKETCLIYSLSAASRPQNHSGAIADPNPEQQEPLVQRDFITTISPVDEMFLDNRNKDHYFAVGASAMACIDVSLQAAGKSVSDIKRILDLPCGHGRVLRQLKSRFPEADITACDLSRDGVDFCASTFGVTPVYSHEDPNQIPLDPNQFDLIWIGSLFTHLNSHLWDGFFEFIQRVLKPQGVVIFTTTGRHHFNLFYVDRRNRACPEDLRQEMIDAYERTGFAYFRNPGSSVDYGGSLSHPSWVFAEIAKFRDLRFVHFGERAWANHQDCFACIRDPGWQTPV